MLTKNSVVQPLVVASAFSFLSSTIAIALPGQKAGILGSSPKYPTHAETAKSCTWWYDNTGSVACKDVPGLYSITLEDFLRWNPGLGGDCTNFLPEWSYCVEADEPTPSTTTGGGTTPTSTGIATPTPTQPGMVDNCNAFYFVDNGKTCDDISKANGITFGQLLEWNPSVGSKCLGLWANVYICVGVAGYEPNPTATTTTSTTTSPTPTNGIETPLPTQSDMVDNCDAFYFVKANEGCDNIAKNNGISGAELLKWNPSIGLDCTGLWANVYVCVSVVNHTPTSTGNGVSTPTPTQEGMVINCGKFHYVEVGQLCSSILTKYSITLANFFKWNPAVKSDCSGLWSKTYCCVRLI